MISITSTWKQYFEHPHEGLGTTYERFILHQYFDKIKKRYSIKTVLEVPAFGMTGISGINSIWWAFEGAEITVVDQNLERIDLIKETWQELSLNANFIYQPDGYTTLPFANHSFDMVWNFAALWFVSNLEKFFKELVRISQKVIFICVPNNFNPFPVLRIILQKNSNNLYPDNLNPIKIQKIMLMLKWHVAEQGYLDIPPWPDIAMNKEDLIQKIGLKRLAKKLKNNKDNYICILDYYKGKRQDLKDEILKYNWLENSPWFIKKFWAHHRYFIFEKAK